MPRGRRRPAAGRHQPMAAMGLCRLGPQGRTAGQAAAARAPSGPSWGSALPRFANRSSKTRVKSPNTAQPRRPGLPFTRGPAATKWPPWGRRPPTRPRVEEGSGARPPPPARLRPAREAGSTGPRPRGGSPPPLPSVRRAPLRPGAAAGRAAGGCGGGRRGKGELAGGWAGCPGSFRGSSRGWRRALGAPAPGSGGGAARVGKGTRPGSCCSPPCRSGLARARWGTGGWSGSRHLRWGPSRAGLGRAGSPLPSPPAAGTAAGSVGGASPSPPVPARAVSAAGRRAWGDSLVRPQWRSGSPEQGPGVAGGGCPAAGAGERVGPHRRLRRNRLRVWPRGGRQAGGGGARAAGLRLGGDRKWA